MKGLGIRTLTVEDVDQVLALEEVCFAPCLRAERRTIVKRFELGHIMLGLYDNESLIGLASFSYAQFDSQEETRLFCERDWTPFYAMGMAEHHNTLIVYNVEISPLKRGVKCVQFLLNAMMQRGFEDGCRNLIGIARIPSYNGDPESRIQQKTVLKEAIDLYFQGGNFPEMELFRKDPLLALYEKIGRCSVLCLKRDYVLEDIPSGGVRAIVYTELNNQWIKQND